MATAKVKLEDLVFDGNLISLRKINDQVVGQYRQAYRIGSQLPLVIIEKGTNRIVSGNHRVKAMLKEYDFDHEVEVILREYTSEKELLLDAVKENSKHGYPLDGISRKSLACALRNYGATPDEMSTAFAIPYNRIETWFEGTTDVVQVGVVGSRKHVVTVVESVPGHVSPPNTVIMPVKRHFPKGQIVTTPQYDEHIKKDLGLPVGQLASQILRWVKNGWVERTPQNLIVLLELKTALEGFLSPDMVKEGQVADLVSKFEERGKQFESQGLHEV
jgi:hypothetical protein